MAAKSIVYDLTDIRRNFELGEMTIKVLQGISLKIKSGEFVVITGESGSGKSTLMNLLGMLDVASSGVLEFDNVNVVGLSDDELSDIRGKKIGFIFQQFHLLGTLTALENVALPLMFQGVHEEKRWARAKKVLTKVGLGDRMHHKPNELSGGQQQRVAIARALVNDPEVILADEPTGNLDSKTSSEVMGIIRQLHKEGSTIILITHDEHLVKFGSKHIVLKDGRVV
ncbi:ABC transporter ATP-binding protein [archaeon]|jgi:putative ABC transport system ATP-binding protein|nr:ABC transporter ATP-binding protein [archaeon]MBT6762604.1 ABC transporter ATP-binding protein [archaeon]